MKIKLLITFLFLCSIFLGIMLFNFLLNPYGIFPKIIEQYPIKEWNMHCEKFFPLKIAMDNTKYKKVIVGDSVVSNAFQSDDEKYVLWVPATDMTFLRDALTVFLKKHPTVEEVYFCLNVSLFVDDEAWNFKYNDNVSCLDYIKILYSYDMLKASFEQLTSNFSSFFRKGEEFFVIEPWRHSRYETLDLLYNDFDKIKDIQNICKENGVKLKFFFSPYHALYLAEIMETGNYANFELIKRELVKRTDYIDFGYVNTYSAEPFPKENDYAYDAYFHDPEHSLYLFGGLMMDKIIGQDEEIGFDVNKNNIEDILKKEKEFLVEYISQNKASIDEYLESAKIGRRDFIKLRTTMD